MISEEKINIAVRDAVESMMRGGVEEQEVEELKPREIEFDEVDSLKVSNYLLRIQNERLMKEIEDRRRKLAHTELTSVDKTIHQEFAQKYDVDLDLWELQIDAESKRIKLEPK